MTPQRLRELHRHYDRLEYVDELDGTISEQVAPGEPVFCDFCSADEPTETFHTRQFTVGPIGPELDWVSDENWAACVTCATIVRAGDRYRLEKRCISEVARRFDTPQAQVRKRVVPLLSLFWENFVGEGA